MTEADVRASFSQNDSPIEKPQFLILHLFVSLRRSGRRCGRPEKKRSTMRRILIALLAAVFALPAVAQPVLRRRLEALDRAAAVTPLETTRFGEKYELILRQPLDWQAPEKGAFERRVVVCHAGFDRPTVLVTEGYGAKYAYRPEYREELSQLFDANIVFVEHRYFLGSTPQPCDWRYLTAEASARDLHDVRQLLGRIYAGKWIATGISKGGTTTMLYATFFPGDVDGYVPYVGPVNRAREDGRHERFLRRVGTAEERAAVEEFQREALRRRDRLMPRFERYCREKGYDFRVPLNEIYDLCVLEYAFSFWQWGSKVGEIPSATADDDALFDYFVDAVDPSYFVRESPTTSFFVQAARELGYYGYDTRPLRRELSLRSTKDYLRRIFVPDSLRSVRFDRTLYRRMRRYLRREDPRMAMIYGARDPWTASGAGWAVTPRKRNMKLFVQPDGSHRTRIATLPEPLREEAIATVRSWLE